jgi:hypothetical protein
MFDTKLALVPLSAGAHDVLLGDWQLPDWMHLSQAAKVLRELLDKAGSPDGLLLQLDEGMQRLKRLKNMMGMDTEAIHDFEDDYGRLQVRHRWRQMHM